jgi:hypothetical protein
MLIDWKTCPLHFIFHCKEKDVSLLGYVLSLRPSPKASILAGYHRKTVGVWHRS